MASRSSPTARGFSGASIDRLIGRSLGLPAESCSYTAQEIRIPVDDNVELAADVYLATSTSATGTLLVVTPYGRGLPHTLGNARLMASRGFHVLYVSTRGTFGSGGVFDPGRTDAADSQSVVAWMRRQSWYTGSFATLGTSYSGFTQWALLQDQPADMVAAVMFAGPHDFSRLHWESGTFNLDMMTWVDSVVFQEVYGISKSAIRMLTAKKRLQPLFNAVPLFDAVERHFDGRAPWFLERLKRPDLSDPFWKSMQLEGAVQQAGLPILLNTGWYDVFFQQTMEQYASLRQRGVHVGLTVGPWAHMDVANSRAMKRTLGWLEASFKGTNVSFERPLVNIHVTGAAEWREMPEWPPLTAPKDLHLGPAGLLSERPTETNGSSYFRFNPKHPTPTMGGPLLVGGGSFDDTAFSKRSDVLVFTSWPLREPMEIMGKPHVILSHTRDNPNADIFVRLSEVDAKGVSRNITEAYARLEARLTSGPIEISLLDCAHRFQKGSCVRLVVAGGSHPRFARNLGTGGNPTTGITMRDVTYTVQLGGSSVSKLVLPTSAISS